MLKNLQNKKAQVVAGEYVVVIFLVIGTITAMTVYFKRAIQGRMRDARGYMVEEVRVRTAGSFDGNLYLHYEPYYTKKSSNATRNVSVDTTLGIGGVYKRNISESTLFESLGDVAPPRDADFTTPQG